MFPKKTEAQFFYDGDCGLCQASKRLAQRLDRAGRVTFFTLTSAQADRHLGHLDCEQRYGASHLVDDQDRVHSGAEGVLELACRLPLLASFAFVYRLIPGHMVLARMVYGWVANHRHQLWPNATCSFDPAKVIDRADRSADAEDGSPAENTPHKPC